MTEADTFLLLLSVWFIAAGYVRIVHFHAIPHTRRRDANFFNCVCIYIYIFCFTSIYFNLQPDILVHNFFTHAGCPGGNVPDFRENVPYVKVHRYNPKHLYPKLNGYGNNGERSLKV